MTQVDDAARQTAISAYFKAFCMPGALRTYAAIAREAEETGQGYLAFLESVLAQEMQSREHNRIARHLAEARLPYPKTLDGFDFSALPSLNRLQFLALARGEFVREKENVLLIGNSGLGKTHLGIALAHALVHEGFRARFTTATALSQELLAAQAEMRLARALRGFSRFDLVVVDELGYVPFARDGAELLFQFFAERYERGSVLVTSNLEFSRWTEVFGDSGMTSALIDRLVHRAHIFALTGESYRFRQAQSREAAS